MYCTATASNEKSLNSQNDHQKLRAKLGAKPFNSRQQHWTTLDTFHTTSAWQAHQTTSQQGRMSAVRGSNPLAPTTIASRQAVMIRLPTSLCLSSHPFPRSPNCEKCSNCFLCVLRFLTGILPFEQGFTLVRVSRYFEHLHSRSQ